ncbi:MAG: PrsW family intramembrane metalloprotease [Chitinophagales bacterium]|nr:PrsW family intramembrane metalloprotease [Chitinophagales bacterium]
MHPLLPLAVAIAPGIAIAIFVYSKDKYDREPRKLLIISFLMGMTATIPAILMEQAGSSWLPLIDSTQRTALLAFVVVGGSEELMKYLILVAYAYRRKEFNEPFDGITYSVMISMGFATLENIFYVSQYGMGNALLRMFTAVPAHATFGVIMGYYVGLAKFRKGSFLLLLQGFLFAALMHGAYDFFLMADNIPLIAGGAIVSLILGIRYSLLAIRLHQQQSPFI